MDLERVDTKRAYEQIRQRITTLDLAPGSALNEQQLAEQFGMGIAPVREALKLLAYEDLVVITQRHGFYVAGVEPAALAQLSEIRLTLEGLAARLAAQRAGPDDMAVLEALRREQAATPPQDSRRLFEVDHRFHHAIARAAQNKYLAEALDRLFGLSQRLWYLVLPRLDFLRSAVGKHLDLVDAIKAQDAERAEQIMRQHVGEFYARVQEILRNEDQGGASW